MTTDMRLDQELQPLTVAKLLKEVAVKEDPQACTLPSPPSYDLLPRDWLPSAAMHFKSCSRVILFLAQTEERMVLKRGWGGG